MNGLGDTMMGEFRYVPVFQGETRVSSAPDEVMTTILGSCIAACIWDPLTNVGGLSHFLLPGDAFDHGGSLSFGFNAMELLVNGLLKSGADRSRLQAKLFGGAKMYDSSGAIGLKNIRFAQWYLSNENFALVGKCVGGELGRKIRFWPTSGRVQRCFMSPSALPAFEPVKRAPTRNVSGEVELF